MMSQQLFEDDIKFLQRFLKSPLLVISFKIQELKK